MADGGIFDAIEKFAVKIADKKRLAIFLIAFSVIALRVALLPRIPVPVPQVHDEFSYLLAGDTLVHGRLSNPPHPMWLYFDTLQVNQQPKYMSKYPPAQGAVLALGEWLGSPWIGVLLSVAAMCAAILWMMQGWLPARWALLGAVLVLLRLGIFNYWINSYWGGAVAATGGALVVGAMARMVSTWRTRDALIMAAGAAILANSRPFEGFIFCLPVGVFLLWQIFNGRGPAPSVKISRMVPPVVFVGCLCAAFILFYNWRGTGHPFLSPYTLYDQSYMSNHALIWQKTTQPRVYTNPQIAAFYEVDARQTWESGRADGVAKAVRIFWNVGFDSARFFLWPELCVIFLAIPWILRDRRVRFLVAQFAVCFAGFSLVAWFGYHYAAPLTAGVFTLVVQGLRHIRRWSVARFEAGKWVTRTVVIAAILLAPHHRVQPGVREMLNRGRIEAQLKATPGEHLVIVRYSSQHNVQAEWVFNGADIDGSKIVWAREIPGVDMAPLLSYFRGRKVWLVDADQRVPQVKPYIAAPKS